MHLCLGVFFSIFLCGVARRSDLLDDRLDEPKHNMYEFDIGMQASEAEKARPWRGRYVSECG